jgi:hypothetical protein
VPEARLYLGSPGVYYVQPIEATAVVADHGYDARPDGGVR